LSDIIGLYLASLTRKNTFEDIQITPLVQSLRGSFKMPENFDYKTELTKALTAKYL